MNKYQIIEFLIAPDSDGRITPNFSDPAFSVLVVCRCGTEPIFSEEKKIYHSLLYIVPLLPGTNIQEDL